MRIIRFVTLASVAGIAIYTAVNALDPIVAGLASSVQMSLVDGPNPLRFVQWESSAPEGIAGAILRFVAVCPFVGGLPLGLIVIVVDSIRGRRASQRPLVRSGYYLGLTILVPSILLSGFLVSTFVLTWLASGMKPSNWLFITYFGPQLVVGMWALPAWRRTLLGNSGLASPVRILPRVA